MQRLRHVDTLGAGRYVHHSTLDDCIEHYALSVCDPELAAQAYLSRMWKAHEGEGPLSHILAI